jgi:hypothetical protein
MHWSALSLVDLDNIMSPLININNTGLTQPFQVVMTLADEMIHHLESNVRNTLLDASPQPFHDFHQLPLQMKSRPTATFMKLIKELKHKGGDLNYVPFSYPTAWELLLPGKSLVRWQSY